MSPDHGTRAPQAERLAKVGGIGSRKFNVLDAMILVAAVAASLALCAALAAHLEGPPPPPPQEDRSPSVEQPPAIPRGGVEFPPEKELPPSVQQLSRWGHAINAAHLVFFYSTVFLLCASLAFLVIRLRSPRPRLRRLGRSPGVSACLTVLTMTAVWALEAYTDGRVWPAFVGLDGEPVLPLWAQLIRDLGGVAGPCVIATWAVLLLNGRLRFQRGWPEALGLVLAVAWTLLLAEGAVAAVLLRLSGL